MAAGQAVILQPPVTMVHLQPGLVKSLLKGFGEFMPICAHGGPLPIDQSLKLVRGRIEAGTLIG
jgi:hypothetical protein